MIANRRFAESVVGAVALFAIFPAYAGASHEEAFLSSEGAYDVTEEQTTVFLSRSVAELQEQALLPVVTTKADGKDERYFGEIRDAVYLLFLAQRAMAQSSPSHVRSSMIIRLSDVDATTANIAWSPSVFSNVKVYYAKSSPVGLDGTTQFASSRKLWNRSQVTLKGLSPNTTYFYRVVAETSSEVATSAEASFKTISK